jgi:hypothetical protein
VAELVPNLGADDPVVETVIGNNMNGATRHGLSFPEFRDWAIGGSESAAIP